MPDNFHRIGFVSTRIAGTDGVSLETFKWRDALTEMGHECFYFAGICDQPAERSVVVPEAHFRHPEIYEQNLQLFDRRRRTTATTEAIHRLRAGLKQHLERFVRQFDIDVLVAENALSLPMNIPLGLALTELIAERDLTTIAHHHDFAWERQRYALHQADDYLAAAFPPPMEKIHHVTINSYAARQLARRTGMRSTVVPNVMDFENPPAQPGEYAADLRATFAIPSDQYLFLQPTRIVPRKRIELAIQLARWLNVECTILIPHGAGDEGLEYKRYIERTADGLGVRVVFAENRFAPQRGQTPDGEKIYSLADAYHTSNLVTYPSAVEGFGNAFLETIYFKRPLVMSSYEIFETDIQPKGFDVIAFHGFISDLTLDRVQTVLYDPELVELMTDHNYRLATKYYSYDALRSLLGLLIQSSVKGFY
jgi:glycosyltransferase involved in cell wall biosynthesis